MRVNKILNSMKKILFAFLLAGLLTHSLITHAQVSPAPVIPDFTFQTLSGNPFTKANLVSNKKIIFILFDVTCSHCQHEMQAFGKQYSKFKNVAFYLVSMDTKDAIEKFMNLYGQQMYGKPNVTVLRDFKPEFIVKFQPDKYPAIFLYGSNRRLIKYFSGQKDIKEIIAAAG